MPGQLWVNKVPGQNHQILVEANWLPLGIIELEAKLNSKEASSIFFHLLCTSILSNDTKK